MRYPFGKIPSTPEATTASPGLTSVRFETSSIRSGGFASTPTTIPPARVRSIIAPAAALRSKSSCTRAAWRVTGPIIRPTTPPGAITAMSADTPSPLPRLIVTVRITGSGLPAMTSAASVGTVPCVFMSSSICSRSDLIASACSCCSCTSSAATRCRSASFSAFAPRSPMYPPHTRRTPLTTDAVPNSIREKTSNVTACSARTPLFVCTCAEIRRICAIIAPKKIHPVRLRISSISDSKSDGRYPMANHDRGIAPRRTSNIGFRSTRSVDRDLAQQVEIRQHAPRAEHDGRQRIFRHRERQPGLFPQPLVQIFQHRPAARQHDAAIDDVGRQFRRRPLERDAHRVDDHVHRLRERLANLFVGDGDRLRDAFNQVASLDLHRHAILERVGGTDLHLDRFRGALADQQVVRLLDVLD